MSEEAGRRLPSVEVFELLLVGFLNSVPYPDASDVNAVLTEARKNLAAREELEQPAPVADRVQENTPAYEAGRLAETTPYPELERSAPVADTVQENTPPYEVGWLAAAAAATPCPGNEESSVVRRQVAPWRNPRLRFQPANRLATPAQRREILRRDGFRCSTPGCPNHLWLDVHHIVFYCEGGKTIPENLTVVCAKCHRNIHEGKLVVHGSPGRLVFTDRQGASLAENAAICGWLGLLVQGPDLTKRWWDWGLTVVAADF